MIIIGSVGSEDINYNPTPTEAELKEIAAISRELGKKFLQLETEIILDQYNEVYIRKVAKLAGMSHVTDFVPKRCDWNFVNEIKDAIRKKKNK
jgi:hypothetical protein